MQVTLLSYTKPNLQLNYSHTDATLLLNEQNPFFADNLIEFAGRVCYHSTARINSTPHFIQARMREEHFDIIEHVSATFLFKDCPTLWRLLLKNRYLTLSELGNHEWVASGNARVWYELIRFAQTTDDNELFWPLLTRDVLMYMRSIAPETFALLGDGPKIKLPETGVVNVQIMAGDVTLLGANVSPLENELHGSATFLIGTVDRALSHQMVRHRLGSFSQVSQRYVGVDKADWGFIKPDSIRGDAEKALNAHWEIIKAFYKGLRDEFDVLKEDARCVLPNMCETRFVVTMPMYGWKHFLKLRLDKAAQLPIRRVAQAVDYALLTLR